MDVDAVLRDAPLRPNLPCNVKNCLRVDLDAATRPQLQAELFRLDHVLIKYHNIRNKAENDYRARKRAADPDYRRKAAAHQKAYKERLKAQAPLEKQRVQNDQSYLSG